MTSATILRDHWSVLVWFYEQKIKGTKYINKIKQNMTSLQSTIYI